LGYFWASFDRLSTEISMPTWQLHCPTLQRWLGSVAATRVVWLRSVRRVAIGLPLPCCRLTSFILPLF